MAGQERLQTGSESVALPHDGFRDFLSSLRWWKGTFLLNGLPRESDPAGTVLPTRPTRAGFVLHSFIGLCLRRHGCLLLPPCEGACQRPDACLYGSLLEATPRTEGVPLARVARIPPPLVVDVAWQKWREDVSHRRFRIFLLGSAADRAEAFLQVLRAGAGRRLQLLDAFTRSFPPALFLEERSPQGPVRVALRTPLRLVRQRRVLESFDLRTFVVNLCLRIAVWGHYFQGMDWPAPWRFLEQEAGRIRVITGSLRLVRFERFSARQGRRIPLAGLLGSVVLRQVSPQLFALLKAGEICGVGKGATIGLGRISVRTL